VAGNSHIPLNIKMSKRATSSGTSHKVKVAKTAAPSEVDEISEKPAQDAPEAPVFALLNETAQVISMPATVHEMLSAAIPHCLVPQHAFQESMVEMLEESFRNAEALRREAVDSANTKLSEIISEMESGATKVEYAKEEQAAKLKNRTDKKAAMKSAEEDLSNAKCVLDEAVNKQKTVAELNKEHVAAKESYEQLITEAWTPLKDSVFVGREWRTRDRHISRLMAALKQIDIPASLAAALPLVLKSKSEARGTFSFEVLKYGEAAIAGHVATLSENISNSEANADECSKQVEAAKEKVEACIQALSACQDEVIAAENDCSVATTKLSDEKHKHTGLQPELRVAKKTLSERREALDNFMNNLAVFKQLREPKPPQDAQMAKIPCEETVKDSGKPISGDAEMHGMLCEERVATSGIEQ